MRRRVTPKQAMSARTVDRMEREIIGIRALVGRLTGSADRAGRVWVRNLDLTMINLRLARLLGSVRRSEKR